MAGTVLASLHAFFTFNPFKYPRDSQRLFPLVYSYRNPVCELPESLARGHTANFIFHENMPSLERENSYQLTFRKPLRAIALLPDSHKPAFQGQISQLDAHSPVSLGRPLFLWFLGFVRLTRGKVVPEGSWLLSPNSVPKGSWLLSLQRQLL